MPWPGGSCGLPTDAMGYIGLFFVLAFLGQEKKIKNKKALPCCLVFP
jgi:hypothetical protein